MDWVDRPKNYKGLYEVLQLFPFGQFSFGQNALRVGRLKWCPVFREYEVKMAARCTESSVAKDICVNSYLMLFAVS